MKSNAEGDVAAPSIFSSLKDSSSDTSQVVTVDADQHNIDTTGRQQNPEVRSINKCKSSNGENGGRMEIEIPLSVFNNWLQMYGPPPVHGSRQPLIQEDKRRKSSAAETMAANLTFEVKQSKLDGGNLQYTPSQTCTSEHHPGQYLWSNYNPAYSVLKNAASRDLLSDVTKPCNLKSGPLVYWDLTRDSGPSLPKQVNVSNEPPVLPQDFRVSKPYAAEEYVHLQPESEVLQLNPTSALQLTPAEVMKLRKIISKSA